VHICGAVLTVLVYLVAVNKALCTVLFYHKPLAFKMLPLCIKRAGPKRRIKGETDRWEAIPKLSLPRPPSLFFFLYCCLWSAEIREFYRPTSLYTISSLLHHPSNPPTDHLIYLNYNLSHLIFRSRPYGKMKRNSNC
jgi:hypothetical protein